MKRIIVIIAFVVAIFSFSSCNKDDFKATTSIGPSIVEVGPQGGNLTTTFTSNAAWTATCENEAVTIHPDSGIAGTFDVLVSIPVSTTDVETTYCVTFKATQESSTSTRYFTITQHPLQ